MAKKKDDTKAPENGVMTAEEYLEQLETYRQSVAQLTEEVEQLKSRDAAGQAKIKLVNLVFDTPDSRMAELTRIPRNLVFRLMYQIELEAMIDPLRDPLKIPLSSIRRMAFFKLMRSVDGQHLIRGGMLAEKELNTVEADIGEEEKW